MERPPWEEISELISIREGSPFSRCKSSGPRCAGFLSDPKLFSERSVSSACRSEADLSAWRVPLSGPCSSGRSYWGEMPGLWNPSSCSTGVYPACPVGRDYRTGVESFFLFHWGVAYSIGVKPIQLGCPLPAAPAPLNALAYLTGVGAVHRTGVKFFEKDSAADLSARFVADLTGVRDQRLF